MIDVEGQLRRIGADLESLGRQFAVVGGLAISVLAEPRLTRDADVAVAVADDQDAEALIRQLTNIGYSVLAIVEQQQTGRLNTVRLQHHQASGVVTDLLFASSGIEPEVVEAAQDLTIIPGLELPVARVGHLIAMKLLSRDDRGRPNDADDLRALRQIADDDDWRLAAEGVELIMERGYGRDRTLDASLNDLRLNDAY
ncbi:nucleotidyl transferase AbiEii/AbiGii toxin family protein [Candidatus Neomicrothrix sp.]|jgi:predicted nucleotidyltransferase|uniref:nucleotidyl transferase AbiEii/AbiGii toxin family protein n=1 Tax=Candidatus Neomicrothrix sp. TaxID=2719034 RepID=UPI0016AD1EF9|nr:nucleotidyl transferase AbiEii/AbiGii toxin family protein [Candidatus Microthrix sp.]MBP7877478.1 nucleotidyl transferase AbiEii/AbiGii toxin family protein [Candidatus Microthrix sp.]NLH66007.1 hypothetical protein [Candidatus Microthrix parvicella]